MEHAISIIEELFQHNHWAHGRIFRMCEGLLDTQLDSVREMGFGSLRNTLFHIMAAEQIWIERWTSQPWRAFPTDAHGMSLAEIEQRLNDLQTQRQELIEAERSDGWTRTVTYRDSRGNEYSQPLKLLLLHVANHGIHHRAQVMNFLKLLERTVPVGLDYLMYKLARPTLEQNADTTESLKQFGLEIAKAAGQQVIWDEATIQSYFDYHDWANGQILDALVEASDAILDQPFPMGLGSIRKTLIHLLDAELWWRGNWAGTGGNWQNRSGLGVNELKAGWRELQHQRRTFIAQLDKHSSQRVVEAMAGGPPVKIRVIESLIQLCGHGTYHRAQLLNMLRRNNLKPPAIDVMVWCR
jgi:uncharacterized damage-inducible protein DinB